MDAGKTPAFGSLSDTIAGSLTPDARSSTCDQFPERAGRRRPPKIRAAGLDRAVAVVPVIYMEETSTSAAMLAVAYVANWPIWLAFAVEYSVVMTPADPGTRCR